MWECHSTPSEETLRKNIVLGQLLCGSATASPARKRFEKNSVLGQFLCGSATASPARKRFEKIVFLDSFCVAVPQHPQRGNVSKKNRVLG